MTIPTHLLQSQLALNKRILCQLQADEHYWKGWLALTSKQDIYDELTKVKKKITKYALLQKAIKHALKEHAEDARHWRSVEDDITMHELFEEKKYHTQCASEDYVAECFAGSV